MNWERVTYLLYWSLRISVFALLALILIVSRIRKSRWAADHFAGYPQVPEGLPTLPSDLPAPAVSVLASRKVGPQTYLSILVDMFQKGNLTITGGYDESDEKRKYQSYVSLARQFEPDQPWGKEVYSALPSFSGSDPLKPNSNLLKPNSDMLKTELEERRKAIGTHLDECLQSQGIFDEPPLQVMADRSQGWMDQTWWVLATVILAVGVGLWVNFWLPWWAGAAIGIPIAFVFYCYSIDDISGVLSPTPAGALEISQWWSFEGSLRDGLVSPSLDPSQPDPKLPYAVALNQARQWVSNINALPPWFLPDGPREQTRQGLYAAYRGFIGADSWDLDGGPKKESMSTQIAGGGSILSPLSGEILPELGNLASLTVLRLEENQLTGCVPSSLSSRLNMDDSDLNQIQQGGMCIWGTPGVRLGVSQLTPLEMRKVQLIAVRTLPTRESYCPSCGGIRRR